MSTPPGYNINTMLNLVCGKIHSTRQKELNAEEVRYVMAKLKSLDQSIFIGKKLEDVVPVIAKIYSDDLKKLEKYQAREEFDIHDYMVNTIGGVGF